MWYINLDIRTELSERAEAETFVWLVDGQLSRDQMDKRADGKRVAFRHRSQINAAHSTTETIGWLEES